MKEQTPQPEQTDNELIAEFMGLERNSNPAFFEINGEAVALCYNESWDWLMPVVQKINQYCDKIIALSTEWHSKYVRPIMVALMRVDIINTHLAVVNFIKWYNQQNHGTKET